MSMVNAVALVLLIAGGVNWGLVGLFGFDLIAGIFGPGSAIARFVYAAIGLSALCCLALLPALSSLHRETAACRGS